jgi:hypothetical protein
MSSMLALAIKGNSDNGFIKTNKSGGSSIKRSNELVLLSSEEYFEEESDLLLRQVNE